jgi:Neurolysin/Thimet oligopeptidase, N-terminal domain
VKDTKELRDAVETVQPERVKLALRLGQSRALYEGFQVPDRCPHCWLI